VDAGAAKTACGSTATARNRMSCSRWSVATAAAKSSFASRTRASRGLRGATERVSGSSSAMRRLVAWIRKLVRAAELAVQHFQAKLLVGEPPAWPDSESQPNVARLVTPADVPPSTAPTIRAGFDLALDPERGKYGSNRTRRYDQMLKYRERLFGGPRHALPLLDAKLTWDAFVPAEARALWRRMADRHVSSNGHEFGVRAAEGVVDAIYSVAAWLREEQLLPPDAARAPTQWRKTLKEEWAQRTGKRRSRPHRPRHSAEEYRRIFAAITDPRVDPRIRLAIELAAECRTGQVLRCTRRMLVLPDVSPNEYEAAPAGSLGQTRSRAPGRSTARWWS
jgi:hypothetical protein